MSILKRRMGWRGTLVVLAILPVVLAGLFGIFVLAGLFLDSLAPWQPRAQVFAFFVDLDWEAKVEDVEELLQDDKYTLLRREEDDPAYRGTVRISTPSERGEGNWILYLQFDDGLLVAKRIRIADGGHPSGAPDDETAHADVPCPSWL